MPTSLEAVVARARALYARGHSRAEVIRAVLGADFIGYDLQELRAGRSTAIGFHEEVPPPGTECEVLGPSLLHVLGEMVADNLRIQRAQATVWENIRYGTPEVYVARAAEMVRRVEDLRRRADHPVV